MYSIGGLGNRVIKTSKDIFLRPQESSEEDDFPRILKVRALFASGILLVAFVWLLYKLFDLQVLQHEASLNKAFAYTKIKHSLDPKRGEIRDRTGQILATSFLGRDAPVSIVIDWETLKNKNLHKGKDFSMCTLLELCALIGFDDARTEETIRRIKKLDKGKEEPLFAFSLALRTQGETTSLLNAYLLFYAKVRGNMWRRCISLKYHRKRYYTFRNKEKNESIYNGFLRGFVGTVDTFECGMTGVEGAFNSVLDGRPGLVEELRGAKGILRHMIPEGIGVNPIEPCHVYLTADTRLQKILWEALREGLDECKGLRASGIIMDPRDGGILAFGQVSNEPGNHPVFGPPNQFDPLLGYYEPGSVFKPLVAVKALYEKLVSIHGPILWKGGRKRSTHYRGVSMSVWDSHAHSNLTFADGLVKSSNIVFSIVGEKLGGKMMAELLDLFDLEKLPYVVDQLWPRNVKNKEKLSDRKKRKYVEPYDVITMSYGYAVQTTLLVLAKAYSEIINGGYAIDPHVLYGTQDLRGKFFLRPCPKGRSIFKDEKRGTHVCAEVKDLLRRVVQDKGGTGNILWDKDRSLIFGGKTGTAKKVYKGRYSTRFYTGSFIGFMPLNHPRYVVAVKVDIDRNISKKLYENSRLGVYYGGSTAGPIVWKIINTLEHISP